MKIAKRMQGLKSSVGFELLKIGKALKAQGVGCCKPRHRGITSGTPINL